MPNNIDTVKTDESKLLELQVLPADDLKDHASVRSFVHSEAYLNYHRQLVDAGASRTLPWGKE